MPELEAILAKSYEETTMADVIVLFFSGNKKDKKEALKRIDYLQNQNIVENAKVETKTSHSSMHLSLVKE